MDGVSGALAVLSFSIQLIDSVRKAKKFLAEIKNASEEVTRLTDTLDEFQLLLCATRDLLERQNKIDGFPSAIQTIDHALQRCNYTIQKLQSSIDTIETYFKRTGRGRQAWASLKTATKKENIGKLFEQIHRDMVFLQTALMLNISNLQYARRCALVATLTRY